MSLSRRLAPELGAKVGTVAHTRYSLTAGSPNRVLKLSNTPSPHRGAGGLKTLRDTAARLGFQALVARKRGPSIQDDLFFGEFSENLLASFFLEFHKSQIFHETSVTSTIQIDPRHRLQEKGTILMTFRSV